MLNKNIKILAVDDLPVMRKIFTHLANQIGLQKIDTVASAPEALEKLRENKYDVILCDWKMPEMDGIDLLNAMRQEPELQKIPFIMVTSEGSEEKVKQAIEAGVDNYIVKPMTAKILEDKLSMTFQKKYTSTETLS